MFFSVSPQDSLPSPNIDECVILEETEADGGVNSQSLDSHTQTALLPSATVTTGLGLLRRKTTLRTPRGGGSRHRARRSFYGLNEPSTASGG